jgi:hypothetical protein
MLGKKSVTTVKRVITQYKFNVKDSVLCTIRNCIVKNATIVSRSTINGENFYKIEDDKTKAVKICKERELIHR